MTEQSCDGCCYNNTCNKTVCCYLKKTHNNEYYYCMINQKEGEMRI